PSFPTRRSSDLLQSLVPATYFMVTFTLANCAADAVMQCAWDTLNTFSHNDAKLGATPGAMGALHTHRRRLDFHPHVHMVMPAAALDTKRKLWRTQCVSDPLATPGGQMP